MRTIDRSSAFQRDYKREAKGQHRVTLDDTLRPVLVALATDQPLDARYRDHDLSGDWAGYRECHVKPDLLHRNHRPNMRTEPMTNQHQTSKITSYDAMVRSILCERQSTWMMSSWPKPKRSVA
ncbi:type II toxin-antitoxin system YafQ family toxin [Acidithiobacillus sp. 'AMD consortium']|nr:type II toxin-antitoxin system YafQ family toxin [Acidithiobacillus ferridurans]QFG77370.1 type II toxin-antitoxin system YafQ family toxin [Acidithiobacillus sp. 'AMD consortium']